MNTDNAALVNVLLTESRANETVNFQRGRCEETALMMAAFRGNLDITRRLLACVTQ